MSRTLAASSGADATTDSNREDELIIDVSAPIQVPRILQTLPPAAAPNLAADTAAAAAVTGKKNTGAAVAAATAATVPTPPGEVVAAPATAVVVAAETVSENYPGSTFYFVVHIMIL